MCLKVIHIQPTMNLVSPGSHFGGKSFHKMMAIIHMSSRATALTFGILGTLPFFLLLDKDMQIGSWLRYGRTQWWCDMVINATLLIIQVPLLFFYILGSHNKEEVEEEAVKNGDQQEDNPSSWIEKPIVAPDPSVMFNMAVMLAVHYLVLGLAAVLEFFVAITSVHNLLSHRIGIL